jgi:two-component system phosphate regulon sensor histidine kinase PhoR
MRRRFFTYVFTVSLLATVITGIISFIVMRSSVIDETEIQAAAMAKLVIQNLMDVEAPDYDKKAKTLGRTAVLDGHAPYRITVIDGEGVVLGDSEADIEQMDNHGQRPEVLDAKSFGIGSSRRDSATLNMNMLYVAVYDSDTDITVRVALPLVELRRITYNLLIGLLISISAGVVISVMVSLIFADRMSKPINELAEASYEFAGGNLNKRVHLNTATELDQLSNAFNTMAGNLKRSLTEIKQKNEEFNSVLSSMHDGLIALGSDKRVLYMNPVARELFCFGGDCSTETVFVDSMVYQEGILEAVDECLATQMTQALDLKLGINSSAQYRVSVHPMLYETQPSGVIIVITDITRTLELEQMRTDFVANVSHELRTPLTSIKGYAETLKEEDLSENKTAKRFLEIIEIEAERLNVLINDLMELSKIENKNEDVNISSHSLKEILDETAEVLSMAAEKKGVKIQKDIDDSIVIYANRDRIKQLVLNLMDNGIKYNKDGGKLTVDASAQREMLTLSIKDTGEGIAQADIPRLFERFYRVDKSRSKELGGTGLGLSIVKHISELYGGSVTVLSKKGKGSEFIVKLPIVKE